ncbi:hypothetical protein [Microbulbifer sp. TYP-18]|uniref:hypothetical protein n=1 Tax=Microbulbifer sp. TYP-18 TaxID=3230024 RepID=UPI0034C6B99C
MAKKQKFIAAMSQMTQNGAPVYAGCERYRGEAVFTASFNTCYFNNITLTKVKGGDINDSNYKCEESGEYYRVMKFDKLQ